MNRFSIAALAALFALSSSSAIILSTARQTPASHPGIFSSHPGIAAADRDDNEQGDNEQGDHHDNGKHKGWYKHGRGNHGDGNGNNSITGVITGINGNLVTLRLNGNRYITVNDRNAVNNGNLPNLWVGERVRVYGSYGNDGVFYGNTLAQAGSGSYDNGGYANNGSYGSCGSGYNGNRETVTGYATGGINGNGYFTLQTTPVANIPVPIGPRYTIHVGQYTCVNGQNIGSAQLDLGRHVQVTGVPVGDGRTIDATNITYV